MFKFKRASGELVDMPTDQEDSSWQAQGRFVRFMREIDQHRALHVADHDVGRYETLPDWWEVKRRRAV
jgi:hypothetical protein